MNELTGMALIAAAIVVITTAFVVLIALVLQRMSFREGLAVLFGQGWFVVILCVGLTALIMWGLAKLFHYVFQQAGPVVGLMFVGLVMLAFFLSGLVAEKSKARR